MLSFAIYSSLLLLLFCSVLFSRKLLKIISSLPLDLNMLIQLLTVNHYPVTLVCLVNQCSAKFCFMHSRWKLNDTEPVQLKMLREWKREEEKFLRSFHSKKNWPMMKKHPFDWFIIFHRETQLFFLLLLLFLHFLLDSPSPPPPGVVWCGWEEEREREKKMWKHFLFSLASCFVWYSCPHFHTRC